MGLEKSAVGASGAESLFAYSSSICVVVLRRACSIENEVGGDDVALSRGGGCTQHDIHCDLTSRDGGKLTTSVHHQEYSIIKMRGKGGCDTLFRVLVSPHSFMRSVAKVLLEDTKHEY